MKNLLKKVGTGIKNNKLRIGSAALSVAGLIISFASSSIEGKQLDETIDQKIDAKIASIVSEEKTQNEE